MKFFLVWAFITSTGGLSFSPVGEFAQMRQCIQMKKVLQKQKGKWAKGSFNCVWVKK